MTAAESDKFSICLAAYFDAKAKLQAPQSDAECAAAMKHEDEVLDVLIECRSMALWMVIEKLRILRPLAAAGGFKNKCDIRLLDSITIDVEHLDNLLAVDIADRRSVTS